MGVRAIRYQAFSCGGDRRKIDVVPVNGGRRVEADDAGVKPCAQVQSHRVRVAGQKARRDLVQLLGAECGVEHEVRTDMQRLVVVVERADNRRPWRRLDGCAERLSSARQQSVKNRLSSSGVKAGSVIVTFGPRREGESSLRLPMAEIKINLVSACAQPRPPEVEKGWSYAHPRRDRSVQQPEGAGAANCLSAAADAQRDSDESGVFTVLRSTNKARAISALDRRQRQAAVRPAPAC